MFGFFKRKPAKPPTDQPIWECGPARGPELLEVLDQGTTGTVAYHRDGKLLWSRDVTRELHEFTCQCAEEVLQRGSALALPVYLSAAPGAHDPHQAALQLAQQASEPAAKTLQRQSCALPASFASALDCKRNWLCGTATKEHVLAAAQTAAADMQGYWPSSFCLQINGLQTAYWCVMSAMNLEQPWLGASGCAQTASWFLGSRLACETIGCVQAAHDLRNLVWEGAQIGDRCVGRGIGCPQAHSQAVEKQATAIIEQERSHWRQEFGKRLSAALQEQA